jgi:hypothetical protein
MLRKYRRYFISGLIAAIVVTELVQPAMAMDVSLTLFPKDFNEVLLLVPISLVGTLSTLFAYGAAKAMEDNIKEGKPLQVCIVVPAAILAGRLIWRVCHHAASNGQISVLTLFHASVFASPAIATTLAGPLLLITRGVLWDNKNLLCRQCKYYHHGEGLMCAVHPYGPDGDSCLDWEPKN